MSALSNRGTTRERGRSAITAVAERYGLLIALLVVIVGFSVILPLTALIIGTSVLGAEIDDGSIVHLLATPVRRSSV